MSTRVGCPRGVHVVGWSVAISMLAFSSPAIGQVLYGSIVGTVTDESGLSAPGATVTITQSETNQSREATTNASGGYTFSNLAPGTYDVNVVLPGFQPFRTTNVE